MHLKKLKQKVVLPVNLYAHTKDAHVRIKRPAIIGNAIFSTVPSLLTAQNKK